MAIKARYKGGNPAEDPNAEYLNGVPARNLDEDEYDALDPELKKLVRESSLYDVRLESDRHAPAPAKADPKGGGS